MNKLKSLFVVLVLVLFTFIFLGWNYFPYWISHSLSKKIGASVSIAYINLTPNAIRIYDLNIDNPPQFKLKQALTVKKIRAKVPISSFFHKEIVIDEINLSSVYLGIEIQSPTNTQGNWNEIMNRLKPADSSKGESKKILIKTLTVDNLTIDLLIKSTGEKAKRLKPIEHMEFHNISSEGPFPAEQLTSIIMSEVLKEIFSLKNFSNMLKESLVNPPGSASDVINSLKSLFSFTDY